jgi:lipopolysaccharide/colanic/teichoic acid biosynthesis glycosyltransferase
MQDFRSADEPSAVSTPSFSRSAPPHLHYRAADRERRFESPTASVWTLSSAKRLLDLSVALLVLFILGVPMLAIAVCVRITSRGPAIFSQHRVGRGGRLFRIYKFRTMTCATGQSSSGLTRDGDNRITPLGRWLRRLKLDELPQFYNVLRGEMSLVGPRPKLPQYLGISNMPYRPGITGAASLVFRREEEILSYIHPSNMDDFYHRRIRPLKARIDVRYMCRATFQSDMLLIAATFLSCLSLYTSPVVFRQALRSTPHSRLAPVREADAANSFESVI